MHICLGKFAFTRRSKSALLLLLSFDEILKARLAFDVYEMNALRNDKDNLKLILQTIRVNRSVDCIERNAE